MPQFRKKPVVIEAVKWTGENLRPITDFIEGPSRSYTRAAQERWEDYEAIVKRDGLKIKTLEGEMSASLGDWIIRGVKGEFYPCKPDIFEATYDAA